MATIYTLFGLPTPETFQKKPFHEVPFQKEKEPFQKKPYPFQKNQKKPFQKRQKKPFQKMTTLPALPLEIFYMIFKN
ncbi:28847_t:CDS:1, partial [Dentiscutata erythropus]